MKKITLFLLLAALLLASCTTSIPFDTRSRGYELPLPIREDVLAHSIRVSMMTYNWLPIEDDPGRIRARYEKSGGLILCDIEIIYDRSGYEVRYLKSKNLDYDERRGRIHKNYVRWINNLNKSIYVEYMDKVR